MIKQQLVAGGDVLFANATIAGRDAKVISALYSNEDWNTVISAFSDIHMHHIYAEGRLEGDKLEKLVKLAEHLVDSANIGLLD
ncbi:MAG: hypothetical protein OXG24_13790 [Gammaproteobacteria bacterium]|nr:hypothetical protein [Gammaproteobacteria bacterium]